MLSQTASAATGNANCDKVNIVYCGLEGSSLQAGIDSFKAAYTRGSDHGHADLKPVFRWAGASDATVQGMTSRNTKMGTLYRNGDIKVNSTVVGHDSWVAARFTEGQGFTKISSDAWGRRTTTSFAGSSAPVLVHYSSSGTADFAVMTNCGNAVRFTPTAQKHAQKPQPRQAQAAQTQSQQQTTVVQNQVVVQQQQNNEDSTPESSLECMSLGKSEDDSNGMQYDFEARAFSSNEAITAYTFDFGDGQHQTVNTNEELADVTHTFPGTNSSYTVRATVTDAAGHSASGEDCSVTITPTNQTVEAPADTTPTPTLPTPTDTPDTTTLPHTGMNTTAAGFTLFGATMTAGALLYRFFAARRQL